MFSCSQDKETGWCFISVIQHCVCSALQPDTPNATSIWDMALAAAIHISRMSVHIVKLCIFNESTKDCKSYLDTDSGENQSWGPGWAARNTAAPQCQVAGKGLEVRPVLKTLRGLRKATYCTLNVTLNHKAQRIEKRRLRYWDRWEHLPHFLIMWHWHCRLYRV